VTAIEHVNFVIKEVLTMKNKWLVIGIGFAVVLCAALFVFGPSLWQMILTMHG
jgi:hypothetical protein